MLDEKHPFITVNCCHCGRGEHVQLSCGERTCPTCRKKWFGYHYKGLLSCVREWPAVYSMTLTVKNFSENDFFKSDVKKIRDDFGSLRRRFPKQIKGGFYVVQVTSGEKGWHLHLHCLFEGSYIDKDKLSRVWREITGNSHMVNIQQAKDPARAIRYLLSDFSGAPRIRPEDYQQYNGIFKGARLVQPFGTYKGFKFRKKYACPECGCDCWVCLDRISGRRSLKEVYEDDFDSS